MFLSSPVASPLGSQSFRDCTQHTHCVQPLKRHKPGPSVHRVYAADAASSAAVLFLGAGGKQISVECPKVRACNSLLGLFPASPAGPRSSNLTSPCRTAISLILVLITIWSCHTHVEAAFAGKNPAEPTPMSTTRQHCQQPFFRRSHASHCRLVNCSLCATVRAESGCVKATLGRCSQPAVTVHGVQKLSISAVSCTGLSRGRQRPPLLFSQ